MDTKKELKPRSERVERVVVPAIETPKSEEQNLETLSWMEKIEKRFGRVPNQTSDMTDDTVVVQPFGDAQGKQPPVTLPVNQQQMQAGQKAKTDTGLAWLVTWVMRQIKLITRAGGKVRFQDIPEVKE